jgi:hypothetical protein
MNEILIYEYFRFIANEGESIVGFNVPNKVVIGDKILKNWGTKKGAVLTKLLAKPKGKDFAFLGYNNSEKDIAMLKAISDYLVQQDFQESNFELKKYFKL